MREDTDEEDHKSQSNPFVDARRALRGRLAYCVIQIYFIFCDIRNSVTVRMSQVKQNPFQRQLPITIEELFKGIS